MPGFCLASPVSVHHQFQQARNSYLAIKQKDLSVEDLAKWESVGSKLRDIVVSNPEGKDSPRAAFLVADLLENIYRARNFRSALNRSYYYYSLIISNYANHYLADDALYRLGENSLELEDNQHAALGYFKQIVDSQSNGDMHELAGARVNEIESLIANSKLAKERGEQSKKLNTNSIEEQQIEGKDKKKDPSIHQRVIVIDPGHGGEEEGAVGVEGYLEKDIVLRISLMLEGLIKERLSNVKVVLTRRTDVNIPFSERTKMANDANADLFISIHANASISKKAEGIETYYLDNTNDASSLTLAKRENEAGDAPVDDLSFIISDLIQYGKLNDSISLAHYLQDSLVKNLSSKYSDIKNLGVKKAPFYVLVGAHMACALTEVSFIDHPVEGARLIKPEYQHLVAEGLFNGIKMFFEKK